MYLTGLLLFVHNQGVKQDGCEIILRFSLLICKRRCTWRLLIMRGDKTIYFQNSAKLKIVYGVPLKISIYKTQKGEFNIEVPDQNVQKYAE